MQSTCEGQVEYKLTIDGETKTVETIITNDSTIHASIDRENINVSYALISDHQIHLVMNGVSFNAYVMDGPDGKTVSIKGISYLVEDAQTPRSAQKRRHRNTPTEVTPVTPSVVISVLVKEEEAVKMGQGVIVLSAMKMETTLTAPFDGIVTAVNVAEGESVSPGQILVDIEKPVSADDDHIKG
jgi:biotin carboxyl carrier protein